MGLYFELRLPLHKHRHHSTNVRWEAVQSESLNDFKCISVRGTRKPFLDVITFRANRYTF